MMLEDWITISNDQVSLFTNSFLNKFIGCPEGVDYWNDRIKDFDEWYLEFETPYIRKM